jgi:hypothetical protein
VALFRRRRAAALPAVEPTAVAVAPIRTVTPPTGPQGLAAGWAGMGVLHPSDQIGRFAGTQLTQVGGYVTEVQRWQGVEGTSSAWIVPPQVNAGYGWQLSMHTGNAAEAQRLLDGNNGGLGPITARAMRANVTAQQIRQSGLAAVQWAQALSPVS